MNDADDAAAIRMTTKNRNEPFMAETLFIGWTGRGVPGKEPT